MVGRRILKSAAVGESRLFRLPLKRPNGGAPEKQPEPTPEELLRQAVVEAEEIRKQAYEEGQRRGYQEGIAQSRTEAEKIRNAARSVLREAEDVRRRILDELESEVRMLAVEIAEKLVARQLELDPASIAAVVHEALEAVRERENVVVYAHPSHVEHLRKAAPKLKELLPAGAALRIIGDAELDEGGVLVETERGLVDATTDVRWREILKALK
jgi:flagellar biosynthesis/type III secretory pathway protein FliH